MGGQQMSLPIKFHLAVHNIVPLEHLRNAMPFRYGHRKILSVPDPIHVQPLLIVLEVFMVSHLAAHFCEVPSIC